MRDRLRAGWKRLPRPVRAAANHGLRAVLHGSVPLRVAPVWRRGRPASGGVEVVGLHGSVIGVGEAARMFAAGLRRSRPDVHAVDVSAVLGAGADLPVPASAGDAGVVVSHLNPPELMELLARRGGRWLSGRRHIGFWAWELPAAPDGWRSAFRYVDEVWCQSAFTAAAVRRIAPPGLAVRVLHHPVFVLPPSTPRRREFGWGDGECVFLAVFDVRSSLARKNPAGAVEAYRRAFPEPGASNRLVLKVSGLGARPDLRPVVDALAAGRPDIQVIAENLSAEAMGGLIAGADVLVSLHRAEGFGLVPAQAMWAGRPAILTDWSATAEFADAGSACLVPAAFVDVDDPQGVYVGQRWADPDLAAAADCMRRLGCDPELRADLGRRARARAEAVFDEAAWTAQVEGWLAPAPVEAHQA